MPSTLLAHPEWITRAETIGLRLAPCTVLLPAYQRTGAGSAAVLGALRAATELGEALVVVLGHPS